jgi:predicted aspartyl protease
MAFRSAFRPGFRAAAVLAALLAGLESARAETCQLKEFASVPADFRGSHILIDVSINDQPARLVVDTGAGVSMLDPAFVARLGLPIIETGTLGYGLTGRGLSGATRVAALKLGNAVSRSAAFVIAHIGGDGHDGAPVGLFAADYLFNYDVEIDPAAGRLKLFAQDHCPGKVVYWAKEYFRLPVSLTPDKRLDVDLAIDGRTLRGMIDTGANATSLRLAVARRLFDFDPAAAGLKHGKAIGADATPIDVFPHVFDSLAFGGITLRNTTVQILDMDSGRGASNAGSHIGGRVEQEDAIIGMSLLRKLHVFIAYGEPAFYFTLPEPAKAP